MTSLRLAFVGDMHIVDEQAAPSDVLSSRSGFLHSFRPAEEVIAHLNASKLDHVFFLGDLLDWFSAPNAERALSLLGTLTPPWTLVPGNHDFESVPAIGRCKETEKASRTWWSSRNYSFADRIVEFPGLRVLAVDSALSAVGPNTPEWTRTHATTDRRTILVTHVPVNTPAVVKAILAHDSGRPLTKYVQSGSPDYFDQALKGRVTDVFTGHLHFTATAESAGTTFHMIPLGGARDANGGFPGVRIVSF